MMPLTLNLLSPQKKQKFSRLLDFLFIKEILEFIILTCSLIAMAFLLAWFVLNETVNDLSQSTTLVNKEYSVHNQTIKEINDLFRQFNGASENFRALTPLLFELIADVPETIKISGLHLNRKSQTLTIAGTAKTRPSLIEFQEVLTKISWIKKVSAPSSQLFEKENINFNIQASIALP